MKKEIIIWSEGTRMAADLFVPDGLRDGEKRPAILLCHGWAGPKLSRVTSSLGPLTASPGATRSQPS